MGKVLCIWELGSSLGHITRLARVAEELISKKHDVSFAISELKHADQTLSYLDVPFFQAPVWKTPVRYAPKPPANFAEILMHFGFADPASLAGLLKAWKYLLQQLKPDLVLVDYSPAALLVARSLGIKSVVISTGFCMPPDQKPMPTLLPWAKVSTDRLLKNEQRVLETINTAAGKAGIAGIQRLYDIFSDSERFLATYPELDHYCERKGEAYRGLLDSCEGKEIEPPDRLAGKPHVFAYLKRGYDRLVLDVLKELGWSATIFAPAMPEHYHSRFEADGFQIYKDPVALGGVLQYCDFTICHAGHGTIVKSLLAGKPLLLLPQHAEQRSISDRVVKLGAAVMLTSSRSSQDIKNALHRLANTPEFTMSAKRFAAKYSGNKDVAELLAQRCTQLLN